MPRFFFHLVYSSGQVRDEEGTELETLQAAKHEAKSSIRDIAAENLRAGVCFNLTGIDVMDIEDNILATVSSRRTIADAISDDLLPIIKFERPSGLQPQGH